MNGAGGNPGFHQGAETTRTTAWRSQQYFAAATYDTVPATIEWYLSSQQVRFITLTANSTINFPHGGRRGGMYTLVVKQDATGSRTLSFTAQNAGLGSGTWKWAGGSAPTLTTTASKIDVLTFIYDGTDMIGVASLNA